MLLSQIRDYVASHVTCFRPVYTFAIFGDKRLCCFCKSSTADLNHVWLEWLDPLFIAHPAMNGLTDICGTCYVMKTWLLMNAVEPIKDLNHYKTIRSENILRSQLFYY